MWPSSKVECISNHRYWGCVDSALLGTQMHTQTCKPVPLIYSPSTPLQTFSTTLPLFFISVSPPSVIYYFSLFGLLPGLERLPWRQKQIWCRDEKWIIQSEGAMSVCVRVTQCWRVFFAGFNNSWLAIILLIEYLIWIRACVCVYVCECECLSAGVLLWFFVHNLKWHHILFLAQSQPHVDFLHLCAGALSLDRSSCILLWLCFYCALLCGADNMSWFMDC